MKEAIRDVVTESFAGDGWRVTAVEESDEHFLVSLKRETIRVDVSLEKDELGSDFFSHIVTEAVGSAIYDATHVGTSEEEFEALLGSDEDEESTEG